MQCRVLHARRALLHHGGVRKAVLFLCVCPEPVLESHRYLHENSIQKAGWFCRLDAVHAVGEAERDAVVEVASRYEATSPRRPSALESWRLFPTETIPERLTGCTALLHRVKAATGISLPSVGVGSTPTGSNPPEHLNGVTELHPGNFIFVSMQTAPQLRTRGQTCTRTHALTSTRAAASTRGCVPACLPAYRSV
jgi:hypothetical protein